MGRGMLLAGGGIRREIPLIGVCLFDAYQRLIFFFIWQILSSQFAHCSFLLEPLQKRSGYRA
jgi:hypothetical protein